MTTDQLLASCAAILLCHFLAYYVWCAHNAPVYVPRHEPLPAFTVQED